MLRDRTCLLTVGLVVLLCTAGWAKDTKPKLALTDTVTKDGITWQFSGKAQVGQFVNGDYYVVGPVTVVAITPKPGPGRNGSVLNLPPDQGRSPFDDRAEGERYDSGLRAEPPVPMHPGDALISSISVEQVGDLPAPLRPGDKSLSPVRTVSVLTCLDKPVPADAFRPSYCRKPRGPGEPAQTPSIYLARNLRWNLLPRLARPRRNPNPAEYTEHSCPWSCTATGVPDLAKWAGMYRRPWLDVCFFGFDAPIAYMPDYGRELGRAAGISTLLLMLDFPRQQKEQLLVNVVQRGIDLWGILEAGYPGWQAHGGHGSGRKWPIVFAGLMLGDKEMQSPLHKHPNAKFGEDMQTIYGKGWTGDTALYGGHLGPDGEKAGGPGWGAYEHLQPRAWKSMMNEDYRRCCTSLAWVGEALAIRLLQAQQVWDHPAFFDYVDRWMTEDDTEAVKIIKEQTGQDYAQPYQRQRQCWDPFVEEMWAQYRPLASAPRARLQPARSPHPRSQ